MCITTTPKNTPVWLSALSTNGRVGVCLGKRSTALRCGGMAMEGRRHGAAWADVQGREDVLARRRCKPPKNNTFVFFVIFADRGAASASLCRLAVLYMREKERERSRDQEKTVALCAAPDT